MTPNSSASPYLTADLFLLLRDIRSIAQWASDDPNDPLKNQPIPVITDALTLDPTTRLPKTRQGLVVAEKLAAASGMLESAVFRSQRYSTADLIALEGNSATYM